jgi:repressor LexA
MIDIGIRKDDLIVVRKQNYAEDGDIVVALVDGETTLKRFYRKGNKIILHPENKTMKDIITDNCEVQGILVSCIKMY